MTASILQFLAGNRDHRSDAAPSPAAQRTSPSPAGARTLASQPAEVLSDAPGSGFLSRSAGNLNRLPSRYVIGTRGTVESVSGTRKPMRLSIRWKFILSIGITLIVTYLGLLTWDYWWQRRSAAEAMQQRVAELAQARATFLND